MTRRALALVAVLGLAAGCKGGKAESSAREGSGARKGPVAFPVDVVPVEARRVEYVVTAVGSIDAFERVQVTARVAGVVEKVLFTEGQNAKAGQPLVEIEPARYRLAVDSARAALERAEAARAEAEAGLKRREEANASNPGLIRGEELETWRTRTRTAAADRESARVALAQAQLNLRDAYVRAPVGGTLQTRTVQTGQYVQPGVVLATMLRRDPLLLRFDVPEPDALRLKAGMTARFRVADSVADLAARITHVGGSADEQTRMVRVTGEVDPEAAADLRPGAFAEVTVAIGETADAPVIPETAVRPSERGMLAYVVEGDTARERVLRLGMRTADGLVEVREGVRVGERVVTSGAEALREGVKGRVGGGPPKAGPRPDSGPGGAPGAGAKAR